MFEYIVLMKCENRIFVCRGQTCDSAKYDQTICDLQQDNNTFRLILRQMQQTDLFLDLNAWDYAFHKQLVGEYNEICELDQQNKYRELKVDMDMCKVRDLAIRVRDELNASITYEGTRIVIVSDEPRVIAGLKMLLKDCNPEVIDGRIRNKERQRTMVKKIIDTEHPRLLIINYDAVNDVMEASCDVAMKIFVFPTDVRSLESTKLSISQMSNAVNKSDIEVFVVFGKDTGEDTIVDDLVSRNCCSTMIIV